MGRKPHPIIATHFIRGKKHGQTTNRYAQTCSHCNVLFPTGRPETLFTHLSSCSGMTQGERAEILHQIYNTSSTSHQSQAYTMSNMHFGVFPSASHHDDFDITGLNVLAGAAESAEDLAIDPQIVENEPAMHTPTTAGQPMTFYDSQYGNHFHATTSHNTWPLSFSAMHGSTSPFPDVTSVTTSSSTFGSTTLPTTQWTFEPVITTPTTYVASAPQIISPVSVRTRKRREPYSDPKRARIAEMRRLGACIRCSRLRKPCGLTRPCIACKKRTSKTWIGECTMLDKGQEFNVWYGSHLSNICAMRAVVSTKDHATESEYAGHLELGFLNDTGPKIILGIVRAHPADDEQSSDSMIDEDTSSRYFVHKDEDVTQKLLEYAISHQDSIIEDVSTPALYSTMRIAQGLSSLQDRKINELVWGTCKQTDFKLASIFNLWLVVTLLTSEEYKPTMTMTGSEGQRLDEDSLEASRPIFTSQINAALERTVQHRNDKLRKFDADILNQSCKHLFNLVIGMFVTLDAVEKYCCFMKRLGCPDIDPNAMIEQAQTMAYKYAYCVQNIQMMPNAASNQKDTIAEGSSNGRVDHDMQRIWMLDMCMSEDDLASYLDGEGDHDWLTPTGRLWARLFKGVSGEQSLFFQSQEK